MPTGFTSDLYEGKDITFREYALKCARAFGVLSELHEEPLDASDAEEFRSSDYHTKQLEKAEAEVERIKAWDDDEADRQAQLAYERALRKYEEAMSKVMAIRYRYEAMLARVQIWVPPTLDHYELKKFMIRQLRDSVVSDCLRDAPVPPEPLSGEEYKESQIRQARLQVRYHIDHNDEEENRVKKRHAEWVKALRKSLPE